MRRVVARMSRGIVAACVVLATGLGCCSWALDVDCSDRSRTLAKYLQVLTAGFSTPSSATDSVRKEADGQLTDELTAELASRATSDGLSTGRLDFLRRAFVALDLGAVSEDENSLVFNLNPGDGTEKVGQFSPRVIVHQPALYGPLDQQIETLDETVREARRDALEESLSDLDDVEYSLRYTPHSQEPTNVPKDLQDVASAIYSEVPKDTNIAELVNEAKAALKKVLPQHRDDEAGLIPMDDICKSPDAMMILAQLIDDLGPKTATANKTLRDRLEAADFYRLADLIDGEPRFVFNGSTRQRADAAGPDETTLNVTWQWGAVSYRGAKRYAWKKHRNKQIDVGSVREYFEEHGYLEGSLPLFSLIGEYSRVSSFQIAIPGVVEEFRTEATHKLTAKLTAGCYLGATHNSRLDLTASYDDIKDDTTLLDRFVAELSWTQQLGASLAKIAGGPEFVATVVYANKPEFRGAVDEDLGLRAGVKWSVGKKKDDTKK